MIGLAADAFVSYSVYYSVVGLLTLVAGLLGLALLIITWVDKEKEARR